MRQSLLGIIIIIVLLFLFFNPKLLPGLGTWLGGQSRKPYRQARWIWSSFAGTEEESIQAEREYGKECARVFEGQFPGKASGEDQKLIESIATRLTVEVKDPRRKFNFAVIFSTHANAYALPGGFVYITTALLELCQRNPGEIAFFLGHEIGHIAKGHARDRMTAETLLNAVSARLPKAGPMIRQMAAKGYSRDQELDADREGLRIAKTAGFDSNSSINALKRLAQVAPDNSGLAEYFSTHPSIFDRIQQLEKL